MTQVDLFIAFIADADISSDRITIGKEMAQAVVAELTRLRDELSGKTAKVQITLVEQEHELITLRAEVERLTKERNDMQMLAGKFTTEIRILQERITDERESFTAERKAIAATLRTYPNRPKELADEIERGDFAQ